MISSCFVADYMTKVTPFLRIKNFFYFFLNYFSHTKKPNDKIQGLSVTTSKPIL